MGGFPGWRSLGAYAKAALAVGAALVAVSAAALVAGLPAAVPASLLPIGSWLAGLGSGYALHRAEARDEAEARRARIR